MADTPQLDQLVETIKTSLARVAEAETSALEHALAAGRALTKAKALVLGSWKDWIAVNLDCSYVRASELVRLAHYEEEIESGHATNISHAIELIRGLPSVNGSVRSDFVAPEILAAVLAGEMTTVEAAEATGVGLSTMGRHVARARPGGAARLRAKARLGASRERAAQAALRREEQARAVRKAGGGVAEAYALVRQALQVVDQAMGEVESKEVKAHLATATRRPHAAEDEIVRASKLS